MTHEELTCFERRVRDEHRALVTQCRAIRAAVAQAEQAGWRPADMRHIAAMLAQFQHELADHFAHEESDGCMDEALAVAPHLTGTAHHLLQQHAGLLACLEELSDRAVQAEAIDWPPLRGAIDYWLGVLLAHEQAETRLLQSAFNSDFDLDLE